jgi:uncharacterized membrane protein YdjX (TVP38/TMEM64 family)
MAAAKLRRWLPALLLGGALAITLIGAHAEGVTATVALRWIYETVRNDPWLFLLLCAVRPPLILPISWPVLLCGTLWGLWPGGTYALTGMLLSAASSYWVAVYTVPKTGEASSTSRLGAWVGRLRREGFMSIVLMRLMLLPFDMVNFAAAALHVRFRSFMLATLIGNTVATLIYTGIGASIRLDAVLAGQEPSLGEILDGRQLAIAAALLVASLLLARYIKRRSGTGG